MKKDGGPAFPELHFREQDGGGFTWERQFGMTLRDYFAIHAPEPGETEIATQQGYDRSRNPHNDGPPKPPIRERREIIAFLRYRFADAMLAEREKP